MPPWRDLPLRAWRNRQPQKAHDTAERGKAGAQGKRERRALAAGEAGMLDCS